MPNAKALWLRQTEAARIAQVAVVIESLGELGYLKPEAVDLEPSFLAEAIVRNVDIDGVLRDQEEAAEPDKPATESKPQFKLVEHKIELNAPSCPECGLPMVRRNGMYGDFWGCTGYATGKGSCRKTISIR
jgi:hypothetical protein